MRPAKTSARLVAALPASRPAFTLVELLVAITIFAILATIAIGAFSETGSDRVPAAARQLRGMLAGAQSRAAKDKAARGIRLILDPNAATDVNNLYVTSLAFIGSNIDIEGALGTQNLPATGSTPARTVRLKPSGIGWQIIQGSGEVVSWTTLWDEGNVRVGDRVYLQWTTNTEIEAQERMFIISSVGDDTVSGQKYFLITGPEPPPALDGTIRYRLEIAPELLPNSEPVSLPRGALIDLNASGIPTTMRATINTSKILDVMFDQRGQVIGSLVGKGAVHFYVGQLEDSVRDRESAAETADLRIINSEVVYPQRVVSLIPATGQVVTSEYASSAVDGMGNPTPFILSTQGREAK